LVGGGEGGGLRQLKPHGWRKRVGFAWALAWLTLGCLDFWVLEVSYFGVLEEEGRL